MRQGPWSSGATRRPWNFWASPLDRPSHSRSSTSPNRSSSVRRWNFLHDPRPGGHPGDRRLRPPLSGKRRPADRPARYTNSSGLSWPRARRAGHIDEATPATRRHDDATDPTRPARARDPAQRTLTVPVLLLGYRLAARMMRSAQPPIGDIVIPPTPSRAARLAARRRTSRPRRRLQRRRHRPPPDRAGSGQQPQLRRCRKEDLRARRRAGSGTHRPLPPVRRPRAGPARDPRRRPRRREHAAGERAETSPRRLGRADRAVKSDRGRGSES